MHVNNVKNQELFCQKYWNRVLAGDGRQVNRLGKGFCLNEINRFLIGGYKPVIVNNITNVIAETDKDFKCYKKTDNKITLWRGIDGVRATQNPYMESLISACKKLKKGEILQMQEYAYATKDKSYALTYVHNDGILYEITVPKGSRVAKERYFNFPRCSMFLCTQNKIAKENDKTFHYIKLSFLPDRPYSGVKLQNEKFWTKIKRFFNL